MLLRGKKLGVLISADPARENFARGLRLAEAALSEGVEVYLYCVDDAVAGALHPELQRLQARGLKLFACAYAAHRRKLPLGDGPVFTGLSVVSDLISATDRFISFN